MHLPGLMFAQSKQAPLKDSICHPVLASADVECYTAAKIMLEGADVVLQATAYKKANTLAMASRPGQQYIRACNYSLSAPHLMVMVDLCPP